MSTNICCAPCQRADTTTTENLNWCAECAELICKQCASFHSRFKATCYHKIIAVTKEKALEILATVVEQSCKEHPKEVVTFLCRDHDTLCCNICIITKHSHCKDKASTDDIGKRLKDRNAKAGPLQCSIRSLERKCSFLESGFSLVKQDLDSSKYAILNDIKGTRGQINASLDELEQAIVDDFHTKFDKTESQLAQDTESLFKLENETSELGNSLDVNKEMTTNTQYLLATRSAEQKLRAFETRATDLLRRCRITKFELSLGSLVSDIKTVVKKHKRNTVKSNDVSFSTTAHSSLFIIESESETSLFVNVEILHDGMVLVLDQSQAILRLFDSNLEQTCQMFIRGAKHFTVNSNNMIVVSLNDCKSVKCLKVSGTKIAIIEDVRLDLYCISISKYQNTALLLCSKEMKDQPYGLYPGEVTFKLLKEDKSLAEFSFPTMDKISPWRGFVFDKWSNTFVAISTDGSSLIWLSKSGQVIREKRLENTGRGGLSGLAVDIHGRVYTASTRKIFEITGTGDMSGTFEASINVYSIAVNNSGDELIAVGHSNAIEVFTLNRLDY